MISIYIYIYRHTLVGLQFYLDLLNYIFSCTLILFLNKAYLILPNGFVSMLTSCSLVGTYSMLTSPDFVFS
jgi:hypothetical protein